jgi:hypothetical protein
MTTPGALTTELRSEVEVDGDNEETADEDGYGWTEMVRGEANGA